METPIKLLVEFTSENQIVQTSDLLTGVCVTLLIVACVAGIFLLKKYSVSGKHILTGGSGFGTITNTSAKILFVVLGIFVALSVVGMFVTNYAFAEEKSSLTPDSNKITASVADDGTITFSECSLTNTSDSVYSVATSSVEVTPEAQSVDALKNSVLTINGFNGVLYNDVPNGMPYETENLTALNIGESTNLSFAIENLDTESAKALCGLSVFEIALMPQKCFKVTYNKGEIAGAIITGDAPIDTYYYLEGDVAEVKDQGTLACEDFDFDGWADEDGNKFQPGDSIEISSNVILTAQWSEAVPKTAKAVIYGDTLEGEDTNFVFYYDSKDYNPGDTETYGVVKNKFAVYNSNVDWDVPSQLVHPAWFDEELNPLVSPTSVVFDKSFENFKEYYDDNLKMNVSFNNMSGWFARFITAKEFSGFENIYDGVKNIDCLFTYAFIGQSSTPDVVLDLRRWKLPNLQSAKYCFGGMIMASSDDNVKFNKLSNATSVSLKEVYLPDNFASGEKTENVSLRGLCALAEYLDQKIETIDLGKNFGKKAVDMSYMFYCCQPKIFENISSVHTENCKNMAHMFHGLRAKELDLSSFDTRQVTDMSFMFCGCRVNRIYASRNFDTTNVFSSDDMFTGCTGLEGIKGSKLGNAKNRGATNWTDKTCARIDTYGEEENLPGYFSPKISKSIDVVFYSLSEDLIGGRINAGTTASQPEKNVVIITIPFGAKTATGVREDGINWIQFIYEENGISIVLTYYAIPDEGYSFASWGELPEIITENRTVIPLSFVATAKE